MNELKQFVGMLIYNDISYQIQKYKTCCLIYSKDWSWKVIFYNCGDVSWKANKIRADAHNPPLENMIRWIQLIERNMK